MSSALIFNNITGLSIQLSDDKLHATRKNPAEDFDNAWVFSEKHLNTNDEFQVQVTNMIYNNCETLQFGITLENPEDLKQNGFQKHNNMFKNSWMLQNNKFYYHNDDNIMTMEEYDINLSSLEEGDLLGLKLNSKRELCFTNNGVSFRNVAEDIPENVWVFVNLRGKCSSISIIPITSSIIKSHRKKMNKKLKQIRDSTRQWDDSEICFHAYCGKEVRLSENNHIAQRKNPTNEFRNAVIISDKPLITNKIFKLRIEGLINKWNGSIEFGVTIRNPDSFELPATMTNLRAGTLVLSGNSILTNGHGSQLPYSSTSLDDLKIGDEIGVMRNNNGDINFYINQTDLGVGGNIPIEIEIWVIIDLYGRTIKVAIPKEKHISSLLSLENDLNLQLQDEDEILSLHRKCGRNVFISQDRYSARRINDQEFNNGVVFTNRPLKIGEHWTIKIDRCVDQWAGNLEMGITTSSPDELEIPSTMTDLNIGYTLMLTSNGLVINGCPLSQSNQSLDVENMDSILLSGISSLIEGSTMSLKLIDHNKMQFLINNTDIGIVTLETEKSVYGVIDLYGKAAEVSMMLNKTEVSGEHDDVITMSKISTINHSGDSQGQNFDNLDFSDNNSDHDTQYNNLHSETRMDEMLLNADRSFLKLLTNPENYLSESGSPDQDTVHFHHIHGRNVILTKEAHTAYRPSPNNEFKNALVMSSRPLFTNELFEICVEKMTDHWSGSLEMGVTLIKPEELNFPGTLSQLDVDCWILSGSCVMNNGITARNDYGLDMDKIQVNSKIGIIRKQSGDLHFLLNGVDMGSAYSDVPAGIYVILDLYGQCSQVSITTKTGICIPDEQFNNVDNSKTNKSLAISPGNLQFDLSSPPGELKPSTQYMSVLERTMSVIGKNLSNTASNESESVPLKVKSNNKLFIENINNDGFSEGQKTTSFFCDSIYGNGIVADMGKFYAHNQNLNCVIQFKHSLKTNFYYEMQFRNGIKKGCNFESLSFGIISEKFSSVRYLPDDLTNLKSQSIIINGGQLFINNNLRCHNFAPSLARFKNQVLVGLYFYDNSHLEVFVNNNSVGKVVSDIKEDGYLIINLQGWFNTLVELGIPYRLNNCLSQSILNIPITNILYSEQDDFLLDSAIDEVKLNILGENLEIEDPLIILIVNKLSELLLDFFVIMQEIDNSKVAEKIVTHNDIILCVRKKLKSIPLVLQTSNQKTLILEIQNLLIQELSHRLSYLSELRSLANSHFKIARALRQKVMLNKILYDNKKSAFIPQNSCLILEESKISRLKSGSDFGLSILNQELSNLKKSQYAIQLYNDDSRMGLNSRNDITSIIGLVLLEKSHFSITEDIFRFLMNIPCPKHLNSLSNIINHHLELQKFEFKATVITVEEDHVYFNNRKLCQRMPFNMKNTSNETYLSFFVANNDTEISDIYLSVKNVDSSANFKIFSQMWLRNGDNIKTDLPIGNIYYYIPFIWMKDQSTAHIITESTNKSVLISDIPEAHHQNLIEKHYHDGLNKESTQVDLQSNLILRNKDRQCISILRSTFIKKALALPDIFFQSKLVDCFCNNCQYPINISNSDLPKDYRLPFGWVKYNIRLKKEEKSNISLWKLGYLTLSPGLIFRSLTSGNPRNVLVSCGDSESPQIAWLKSSANTDQCISKLIVLSPWQPLPGCFLNSDYSINPCKDSFISFLDPLTQSEIHGKIALEVRVKPNSYKAMECKIVTENQREIKRIIPQFIDDCTNKIIDCSTPRPINQKTVWILNNEDNCFIVSGLLIKV